MLRKFLDNAYEIEQPTSIWISPIFNVVDMYHYTHNEVDQTTDELDSSKNKPI